MRRLPLALFGIMALAGGGIARAAEDAAKTALPSPAAILAEGGTLRDVAHAALLQDLMQEQAAARAATALKPPPAAQTIHRSSPAPAPELLRDESLRRLGALAGSLARPDSAATPSRSFRPGLYRLPIAGRVLIGTGEQDPGGGRARGLTLATVTGRPVISPAIGRVRYAGPFRIYGDIVILDHGHGWTSLVAGLDRSDVGPGDELRQGDPIGRSGERLLVELRHNGRPVDVAAMIWALRQ